MPSLTHRRTPHRSFAADDSRRQEAWVLVARFSGALALVAVGAVHLQQYLHLYSTIPTIGTLFLLNFAGAAALSLVLFCPVEGWVGARGGAVAALAALGGVALATGSFVSLAISEHASLFGFHEPGYDPTAITVSHVAEVATVVLLGAYLLLRFVVRAPGRW